MIRNVNKLLKKTKEKEASFTKQFQDSKPQDPLHEKFSQNIETLRSIYDNCSDVMFRSFLLFGKTRAMLIYIEGLSDIEGIEELCAITTHAGISQ